MIINISGLLYIYVIHTPLMTNNHNMIPFYVYIYIHTGYSPIRLVVYNLPSSHTPKLGEAGSLGDKIPHVRIFFQL